VTPLEVPALRLEDRFDAERERPILTSYTGPFLFLFFLFLLDKKILPSPSDEEEEEADEEEEEGEEEATRVMTLPVLLLDRRR